MHALVHPADIQDRDGGMLVMATLFGLYPFLLKLYADGGYQGPVFQAGLHRVRRRIEVEIVKRSDQASAVTAKGFAVLPKRWIVERTFAWLNRCRQHDCMALLSRVAIRDPNRWPMPIHLSRTTTAPRVGKA